MSVTDQRRLRVAAGAALLTIAATGCSGLGRTAVGTVSYATEGERPVMVSNPLVTGCHRLAPAGATEVVNNTLVDMILYPSRNCSGHGTTYVATATSNRTAPRAPAWHSYTIVH
ncbi:hypothetical protein J7E87_02690 [Streptomyces sp. ISL-1]|uniref:hypothetical protein n=1 Tax=Streptomyces sp. ISL-1 TaxID=2817657 RepID=UPI001BE62F67|nr:hypothetical protein [Streptomyces sp. ISL-1]MBT2388343.1 hypothetical protein [Streptomyces sp. ISL-1]